MCALRSSQSRLRPVLRALRPLVLLTFGLACGRALPAQEIGNGRVTVRAVGTAGAFTGFDVRADGSNVAVVRFSSARVSLAAQGCAGFAPDRPDHLVFTGLRARSETGLRFGDTNSIRVDLKPGDPYPVVSFDLTVAAFDPARWKATVGEDPFHFLALYLPEAEAWHQRGWLNATPRADRFPLLLDRHAGTPEISAYHYNRNWSYTPPLGAHPLPVIGLWAPRAGRYVGLEFQTTRLADNSEKDIATGYRWQEGADPARPDTGQLVALVYPFGGPGYQQLVFPAPGARLKSHGTLLWSRNLPATDDPNRFVWSFLWERTRDQLPPVPAVPDVGWIPGGIRQADFQGPPPGGLIGGVEKPFQVAGSKILSGWTWHNESPTETLLHLNTNRLNALAAEASELFKLAKHFQVDGDECVFWEKPLAGQWTEEWGGAPVTTLHNANGFAAGRLFLGLYRFSKIFYGGSYTTDLDMVDGVFNWAKHVAWTRNEFADVPSSPFAIGGTLSASFCLEYYMTFKDDADAHRREQAKLALDLARAFTYRYLVMWPSDNNRDDNLDSSFLWEPNSGRDWTGAACANEVFWNLDTLAQVAVHTGDPVLMWALQGSLSRWHLLYQDVLKDTLADYQPGDMTEGYGLYAGNIYGVGQRAGYGFAGSLVMTEPVGNSSIRVLAGEKAALAFRKGATPMEISDYRYTAPGNLAFTVLSDRPKFDLSLTVPYVDLSRQPVAILRRGKRIPLKPGEDFVRPAQALWSLYLKDVQWQDRVMIGEPDEAGPLLPTTPPRSQTAFHPELALGAIPPPLRIGDYEIEPLECAWRPNLDWGDSAGWAGLPRGRLWCYGVPFELAPLGRNCIVATRPVRFFAPIRDADFVYLLYSSGDGPPPSLVYAEGPADAGASRVEALAWRAWPPLYTGRLLVAQIPVRKGSAVSGLDPAGRAVWSMTAFQLTDATRQSFEHTRAALAQGAAEWKRMGQEEAALAALREEVAATPPGTVAILPPKPAGGAFSIAQRIGLLKRAVVLDDAQFVDPAVFNARRLPVALYLNGEDYVHTVHAPGDGAAALDRYVKDGGTLVVLASQPWPLYYATGPGFHRAEPLTERLGLPLGMALEGVPAERLTVRLATGQSLIKLDATDFPYPEGDPRLRTLDRTRIPRGAKYTPVARVIGAAGKDYGDAAGLIEWPDGGRILYVASVLQHDSAHGFAFSEGALRFLLDAAKAR